MLTPIYAIIAAFAGVVGTLMTFKLARTLQESRATKAGFITFGGDDWYQARDVARDVHVAVMVARVQLEMSHEGFTEVVERIQTNYLRWFEALERSIRRPEGHTFQPPLEIRDHYRHLELSNQPLLAKIVVFTEDQTIVLVGNHIYLGGYLLSQFVQLVFCDGISKGIFPKNRYLPVATELLMLGFFGLYWVKGKRIPTRVFEDKSQIRRFYLKRDLAEVQALSDELKMSQLYVIIALHTFMVTQRLASKRLRVTLPVSFEDETSFNTVGGMFLDVVATPDIQTMARQIKVLVKRARWQVSATNHIQRIFPTRRMSENARNLVDFTLTVVPGKTLPRNLLTDEVRNYEFTMDSIDYPVYVMAFAFEDCIHSSFMVNTPDFDTERFVHEDGATEMDLALLRA